MKTFLQYFAYAVIFISTTLSLKAQSQEWLWAKSAGGKGNIWGMSIASDSMNNIYVTGVFHSPFVVFGNDTLLNQGDQDIFITKYSPSGNVIWAKSIGGNNSEASYDIAIDNSGNIIITGYTYSSFTVDTFQIKHNVWSDIFIAKFNLNGEPLWFKSIGGTDNEIGTDVTTDNENNIYVTGYFRSPSLDFDEITINGQDGIDNGFITKYSPDGAIHWVDKIEGVIIDGSTTDKSGNIYLTGSTQRDSTKFGQITLKGEGMFVVKYNTEGNALWVQGGINSGIGYDIKADADGNIYAVGEFHLQNLIWQGKTFTNAGFSDIILVKFNSNGELIWANSFGGNNYDNSVAMTVGQNGNVYLTGSFSSSTINFGNNILTNKSINSTLTSDIFLSKIKANGEIVWAYSAGGEEVDGGYSIVTDTQENLYLTGSFVSPTINFGNHALNITPNSLSNIFTAKLTQNTTKVFENFTEDNLITIFPNPTASQFHITNLEPGNWTITIYTLDGQSVFKKDITEANAMIDLSGKAKGAYVYQLLKDGEVFKSGKLVVE